MNEEIKLMVTPKPGEIIFDNEPLKKKLQGIMQEYEGAVFSDETIPYAKKETAELRKLISNAETCRKEVKKAWEEPYKIFETKVKELYPFIDKPIQEISQQVKDYEQRKREEKRKACQAIFQEEVSDLTFLTFEQIFSEKWLLAGTSMKSIREEIQGRIAEIKSQIQSIQLMNSDATGEALERYYNTLDFTQAIAYINQYEATRRAIEEREKQKREQEEQRRLEAERQRIRAEERKRIQEEEAIRQAAKQDAAEELKTVSQEVKEASVILPASVAALYAVTGTEEELRELELTMTSIGICFERKR